MMISMIYVMLTMSAESIKRISEVLIETADIHNPENACLDVQDGSIVFENGEGMTVSLVIKPLWTPGPDIGLSNSGRQGGTVIPSDPVDGGASNPVF
jgi:hypothetical protein